jgi:hypothetical protein
MTGTRPEGSVNTSPRKKRFDVLAIQPYDEMLYLSSSTTIAFTAMTRA